MSALGFVVDRFAKDIRVKATYKVVTYAGKIAESALASAKATVRVDPNGVVVINVGWEETKNVVTVNIAFDHLETPQAETDFYM